MAMEMRNSKKIKTRDYYMVDIINGATKSGAQLDRRKAKSKNACRGFNKRDLHENDDGDLDYEDEFC